MSRVSNWLAAVAAGLGLLASITSAQAGGFWDPTRAPEQPRWERFINHYVYRPRYTHVYHNHPAPDPYAYRYVRRGYYPYYGSHYWVDSSEMRNRYRYNYTGPKYVYQSSWGRPRHPHHPRHETARPMK